MNVSFWNSPSINKNNKKMFCLVLIWDLQSINSSAKTRSMALNSDHDLKSSIYRYHSSNFINLSYWNEQVY